ncbi:MAG: hypothetical protein A2928_02655 [Candidatus Taylorbacteria bacterium RIFCSPLOWO2_01_FULL_45_15b]|uniref:Homing endonuclease LAGLIDADG domain-containing protein n=1 Tax=Candidatus Taylorbacteria bacterium RIFCSPLOWO2_01_FULL_45_15b TaxID=1802319 RepID=A0A1G2NFE6_9BACT|nr:MAG: hypothetical protein A2928_02655 [Candidatus Taylorbacteria bacterium RIFCSPLOWO2_01_FULL_45_15b]
MKVIPREAGRVTYSTEIRNLKKVPFTSLQRALVIGSILGDGCLCENWSKTNYRLFINHCIEQKEYISWKYDVLKNYILSEPRYYARNNSLTIRTISHSELSELRDTFYRDKQKIIPQNIKKFLEDPRVIAIWFMDDGNAIIRNANHIGYHINTQSFTREENKLLAECLYALYGISATLEQNHGRYRLAIWKQDSRKKIRNLIEPYILKDMYYKLG